MALNIPILSSLDTKGFDKATREFKNLSGVSAKSSYAIKKAAIPAAAALAGLGVVLGDATKSAIEDDAAQKLLASALKKTTGATDSQITANENWISTQGRLLGVTDDELRPVINRFARATGDLTKAQKLATQAMDIAAATGKPLETVTAALEKAYGGNLAALGKLAPEYRAMIKDGATFEQVMAKISTTTGGAATVAANTAAGQFKRLGVALSETKESIGAALLPAIAAVLPFLQVMGQWAQDHTTTFLVIAGVIGGLALAIVGVNAAMTIWTATTKAFAAVQVAFNAVLAANPIVLIALGIAALVAGLVIAYKHFENFRNIVNTVGEAIKTGFLVYFSIIKTEAQILYDIFKSVFNGIATVWNNTVGKLSFSVPSWVPKIGGKGFDVPDIPMLAAGGIVTKPTLALIAERGAEAVIPLSKMGNMPSMGNGVLPLSNTNGPQPLPVSNQMGGMTGGVNITVQTGVGDPVAIGKAVVDALQAYQRRSGPLPLAVA